MADRYDLVILGLGAGGLLAAELAASIGLRVAAVERDRMGGDQLWTGSIPSKALVASARAAYTMRHADRYGLAPVEPTIDLGAVWQRIRDIQAGLAATQADPDRYTRLGVELLRGEARITGPNEVTVAGGRSLDTRYVLVCTGSRPTTLELPGLASSSFLTSDSLFALERPPASLAVVGGGPVGVELAQALTRLGVRVTVLQRGPRLLPRDEPALVARLTERLRADGVEVHLGAHVQSVGVEGGERVVTARLEGPETRHFTAEAVLLAVGRTANVEDLGLEALGVTVGPNGVEVDERGRTSVRSIYVAGDAAGRHRFAHVAAHEAVQAVRDAFFPGRGNLTDVVPWCTFTDPELAHAGLTVAEAEARHGENVDVWQLDLSRSDRARTDGVEGGALVVVTARGRIVGAHLLAPSAGEMIHELALAIEQGMKLADVASLVHVYPTLSTSIGQLAAEALFERAQKLRWLMRRDKDRKTS